MTNSKFYIQWSTDVPSHPQEVYGEAWESGVYFSSQINPPNQSLNDWREEQINRYESFLVNLKKDGKIMKLCETHNPSEKEISEIEGDINFVKWCE